MLHRATARRTVRHDLCTACVSITLPTASVHEHHNVNRNRYYVMICTSIKCWHDLCTVCVSIALRTLYAHKYLKVNRNRYLGDSRRSPRLGLCQQNQTLAEGSPRMGLIQKKALNNVDFSLTWSSALWCDQKTGCRAWTYASRILQKKLMQ